MAGSYNHVEDGWSLIENMGDAHECVEELLWLVFFFASASAKTTDLKTIDTVIRHTLETEYYPMTRRQKPKDQLYLAVQERMEK